MKKLKKLLVKTLLFTMVLSTSVSMCIGAEDAYKNVYSQDFSAFSLTDANYSEAKKGYTASITDEALSIKSNNVTDWMLKNNTRPNHNENGTNGIYANCQTNTYFTKLDTPQQVSGVNYDFTGSSDTAWFIDNVGGRDAIQIAYYARFYNNAWSVSKNEYRMSIDTGRFSVDQTKYNVAIDLFFPVGKKPTKMTFLYKTTTGYGRVYLQGDALAAAPTGEWFTWSFVAENANFSRADLIYNETTFILQMDGAKTATSLISKVSIKPNTDDGFIYTSSEKAVKIPFDLGEVYGDTKVSFDVKLPATERYDGAVMFNEGNNSARVMLANENNDEIAGIQIDSTDAGQKIYAITDSGSSEMKVQLYSGELLGRLISCQINVDWKAKTYTVVLKQASEYLDENNTVYGPIAIKNGAKVPGNALVRSLVMKHNSASDKMMTVLDNISVDYIEDPDRVNCRADMEALELELPEDGVITEAFELPTVGSLHGADITWTSSNPSVISINAAGNSFDLNRAPTRVTVTLTATLDINGVKMLKSFDVIVEKSDDQLRAEEDAAAITLDIPSTGLVSSNFELPTDGTINYSYITWASSNPAAIAINAAGDRAIVTCGARQVEVTLTATADYYGFVATKSFTVTVREHEDYLKAKADAEAIVLQIPETYRVKENFTLPNQGTVNQSTISWETNDGATIGISGNTAVVTRFETNKEVTLTATATFNGFTATRRFKITSATLKGVSTEFGTVQETISGGVLNASVEISYPGKSGTLNFLALVTDPATGQILSRGVDTKPLTNATQYATLTCTVSGLEYAAGNEVKYYYWNDKRESFVNSEPTGVTELTAIGRGKGVRLNWEAPVDDNNSVEYYKIYRDGAYIGTSGEETYLDESAEVGVVYDYEVRGFDANDLYGGADDEVCTPALGMYYLNFEKMADEAPDYANGLTYRQSTVNTSDSYWWITEVEDANGEKYYAATSTDRNIIGSSDKACIAREDANITIEIDYLDTAGNIQFIYNGVIPQGEDETIQSARRKVNIVSSMGGTYEWKTAVVSVTDANFRNSHYWSSSDFGFASSINGKMFIREIRMIQSDLYN